MYYHSGLNQYGHVRMVADEGYAGMVNGKTVHQPKMRKALDDFDASLVLDSGAYQGLDDVDYYIDLVHSVKDRMEWYVVLDVIGDQTMTDQNMEKMTKAGLDPLWVYQVDGGLPFRHLYRRAQEYGFVGIGGLVPHAMNSSSRLMDGIRRLGKVLRKAGAKAHLFGIGSPRVLKEVKTKEWFRSADSQKWLSGKRSHNLLTASGESIRPPNRGLLFTGKECARQNMRQIERWLQDDTQDLFTPHLNPDTEETVFA